MMKDDDLVVILCEGYGTQRKVGTLLDHRRYFILRSNATLETYRRLTTSTTTPRHIIDISRCKFSMEGYTVMIDSPAKPEDCLQIILTTKEEANMWMSALGSIKPVQQQAAEQNAHRNESKFAKVIRANTSAASLSSSSANRTKALAESGKSLLAQAFATKGSAQTLDDDDDGNEYRLGDSPPTAAAIGVAMTSQQEIVRRESEAQVIALVEGEERRSLGRQEESWVQGKDGKDLGSAISHRVIQPSAESQSIIGGRPLRRITSLINSFQVSPTPMGMPSSMYGQADIGDLLVRGSSYLTTKEKVVARRQLFRVAGIEMFEVVGGGRQDHIASHQNNRVRHAQLAGAMPPFVWVVNFQLPGPPFYSFVAYLIPDDPSIAAMLQQTNQEDMEELSEQAGMSIGAIKLFRQFFLGESDEFRDTHFKLIPRIVDGPFIVRRGVPNKAAILGKALKQRYFRGPGYLELDIDIGSSKVANAITGLAISYCKALVVDMALVIEAQDVSSLPEEVVSILRVINVDFKFAKKITLSQDMSLT